MIDRRGMGMRRGAQVGGAGLVVALIAALLTGDPSVLLDALGPGATTQVSPGPSGPRSPEEAKQFDQMNLVLDETERTWTQLFSAQGRQYEAPKLEVFTGQVASACGTASAAVGPFYCPGDRKAYLDLSFFSDLDRRFGAPGDFAQAYVIAHEIGHHVQTLLGVSEQVHRERSRVSQVAANQLSVRMELQADCYAGVWAHHAASRLEVDQTDIEVGLAAASAIGDDTLQKRGRGHVQPETFTHGSSAQRVEWFRRGFESGQAARCDTFKAQGI